MNDVGSDFLQGKSLKKKYIIQVLTSMNGILNTLELTAQNSF